MQRDIKIAIAGNPNSGKTSLFNQLVGARQHVGNWPGVTVEKKEGDLKHEGHSLQFVDLPGTYSLTAYSQEELIARDYLIENKPDVVLNVLDATNLERGLYFTIQLLEMECPLIVVLNMWDEVEAQEIKIDITLLENLLGVPVVTTSAVKKRGLDQVLASVVSVAISPPTFNISKLTYQEDLEEEIAQVSSVILKDKDLIAHLPVRWLAIKLIEQDQQIYKLIHERSIWMELSSVLEKSRKHLHTHFDQSLESIVSESRYAFIHGAIKEVAEDPPHRQKTLTDYLDTVLMHKLAGLPIFIFLLWSVFQLTFKLGEVPMAWIEWFFQFLGGFVARVMPDSTLTSLIVDGVISGVGGVLVFLPNILILFWAISFLEDTGYMARAAFLMDKIMHRFGLHGRSFIPMIMGFGCSVPAFMATRTLKNKADQITTMLVTPFMSCGAKLPVYVLLIGTFFANHSQGNILFGIYLFGVLLALASAAVLKKYIFLGLSEPFVMELPPYRLPTLRNTVLHMWEKARMYIKKAATLILIASIAIWFFSNYPADHDLAEQHQLQISEIRLDKTLNTLQQTDRIKLLDNQVAAQQLKYSIAGKMGSIIEPVIRPLGFDWKIGIALVSGFAAKEVIVSTLGTIYRVGSIEEETQSLQVALKNDPHMNPLVALTLMFFTLLYVPCIAATAVFHKEVKEWKWTVFYILFTTGMGYLVAFLVYQGGRLLGY